MPIFIAYPPLLFFADILYYKKGLLSFWLWGQDFCDVLFNVRKYNLKLSGEHMTCREIAMWKSFLLKRELSNVFCLVV